MLMKGGGGVRKEDFLNPTFSMWKIHNSCDPPSPNTVYHGTPLQTTLPLSDILLFLPSAKLLSYFITANPPTKLEHNRYSFYLLQMFICINFPLQQRLNKQRNHYSLLIKSIIIFKFPVLPILPVIAIPRMTL